jgi:nucleoside-diphosphate-sugar epimerase
VILILGGDGCVVNVLASRLKEDFLIAGRRIPSALKDDSKFLQCDLQDVNQVRALSQKMENVNLRAVVFCAAGFGNPTRLGSGNIIVLRNVAEYFKNRRLIYLSTLKVNQNIFSGEATRHILPYSRYGWTKLLAEEIVKGNFGCYSILRPGFLVTPFCRKYFDAPISLGVITKKIGFAFDIKVKCVDEAAFAEAVVAACHSESTTNIEEVWNSVASLLDISRQLFPERTWFRLPLLIAKIYTRLIYHFPLEKTIDYYHLAQ